MTMPGPSAVYYSKSTPWYYDWSGVYLGGFGGYLHSPTTITTNLTTTGALDNTSSFTANNVQFGGQAGFDFLSPWHVLAGLALDATSGFDHTTTITGASTAYTQEMKVTVDGTVRGRLGYAYNNVLVYGTGGWAWATSSFTRVQLVGKTGNANVGNTQTLSANLSGWTAGGGLALGFWRNWEFFAEYRYVSYGAATIGYPAALRTATSSTTVTSILGGVNFKFNPFVGRY
jgi:opacity protein-like surface antigen